MSVQAEAPSLAEAAAELAEHGHSHNSIQVVARLADGLSLLRELFFARMHGDEEKLFTHDSMFLGSSSLKKEADANIEIEIYEIVEAAAAARAGQFTSDDHWFRQWLARLRLGIMADRPAVAERFAIYEGESTEARPGTFSSLLLQLLPESDHAPLVMYRLFPLAVVAATAIAFGDLSRAAEARRQQISWLSCIADCPICRGRLLENGEKCAQCGNPFWHYEWLTAE
jgi:hypothetical protein